VRLKRTEKKAAKSLPLTGGLLKAKESLTKNTPAAWTLRLKSSKPKGTILKRISRGSLSE